MNNERTLPGGGASPALRDRFLTALDADDHSALRSLSGDLQSCTDILPSTVCAAFGLPPAVPTRKPQRQSSRHDGRPRHTFRQLGIRNFAAKRHQILTIQILSTELFDPSSEGGRRRTAFAKPRASPSPCPP